MLMDMEAQKEMLMKLENEVSSLATYLYGDGDKYVNRSLERVEMMISQLKDAFKDENTYIKLLERDTGDIVMKHFEKGDVYAVCHYAAKHYAFDDIDDTYTIEKIVCDGHELHYLGWQPGMLFEFKDLVTGEIVYSVCHENWDH